MVPSLYSVDKLLKKKLRLLAVSSKWVLIHKCQNVVYCKDPDGTLKMVQKQVEVKVDDRSPPPQSAGCFSLSNPTGGAFHAIGNCLCQAPPCQ